MSAEYGILLIGFIQMIIGTIIVAFIMVKYINRFKKNRQKEAVIRNVHVIVGDGRELYGQNVYIKDGIIRAITKEPVNKKNVTIIDGTDKTLMPGLIDSHVHLQGIYNQSDEESDRFLEETVPEIFAEKILPYGITTIKDLGAPWHFIYKLKEKIKKGRILGPELMVTGPNFTAPGGHPAGTLGGENPWMRRELAREVKTSLEVHKGVKELAEAGVDFLKLTYQGGDYWYFDKKLQIVKLERSLMEQIIREGKEKGLKTTAHVFYKEDVRELLEAGIYGIEHGILDEDIGADDDIVRLFKESGAHFVPTVNAMTYEKDPDRLKHSIHNLKILYDAGVFIAMGTDNMLETMTGETEHQELQYYVEAGLTPMEAIVLATKNGAEHLGIGDRKGCVKEGMEADLILLDKNPAEDISYMQFINRVFIKGKQVYSVKAIQSYEIPGYEFPVKAGMLAYISENGREGRKLYVEKFNQDKTASHKIYRDGKLWAEEYFEAEENFSVKTWHYIRKEDNTDITAVKEGGVIRVTGVFIGKAVNKNLKIGEGLWYQMMDQAMPAFICSDLEEIIFYSIGTGDNRGAMGLGEFAAKKLLEESLVIGNKSYQCVKISFVLTIFSWAWTGLYWYDKNTGILVQSGEKKAAGGMTIQYRIKESLDV